MSSATMNVLGLNTAQLNGEVQVAPSPIPAESGGEFTGPSGRTPMGSALAAGTETLSYSQEVGFELYARIVLPLDGYVFWVKATELSYSALLNVMGINTSQLNAASAIVPPPRFVAQGSVHYTTDVRQTEASNYGANNVRFTSLVPIQNLNALGSNLLYIASFDGSYPGMPRPPADTRRIRFAFSSRSSFYVQANLWHYSGFALYPTMASQIVEDASELAAKGLVVSNSLPFWLAFNQYSPPYPLPVPRPAVTLYPSMLSPDNAEPPYGTVHIAPDATEGVQMAAYLDRTMGHHQLAQERVTLTLYGCTNSVAQSFIDSFLQYSFDTELFGVTNSPVPMDDKEGQNEFSTLAQKKRAVFDVSYNQTSARSIARQLIESCIVNIQVGETPIPN